MKSMHAPEIAPHIYRMSITLLLISGYIYIYPYIYRLWALRSFVLAFLWGILLSSSARFSKKTITFCIAIGIFGFVTYGVYDIIIFPAIGTVAAFLSLPGCLKFSDSKIRNILSSVAYRFSRSVVALSCGLLFLYLPISRNPGIGEYAPIEISYYYFAGLVGFMTIPVFIYDALIVNTFSIDQR